MAGGRHVLHGHDSVVLEVWREFVLGQIEDCDQAEVVEESFDTPLLRGLTVARDAQPVEFSTFDPRVYAMLAHGLGHDDIIWMQRASFASAMVRERWPDQFEPRQEAASLPRPWSRWVSPALISPAHSRLDDDHA
jgi:hypothetical protein